METKEMRKDWEYEVVIKKYLGKWEASDGVDTEVGNTPDQALEDLWLIAESRIMAEYQEMMEETEFDQYVWGEREC